MERRVYILLPVHNRKEITERFINCLNRQSFNNYQLVLIDDGCIDGTVDMVKSKINKPIILTGSGNLWWGGSLNIGIDWLYNNKVHDSDIVLLINDDVSIEPGFLETGVKLISGTKKTLLLAQFQNPTTGNIEETGVHAELSKLQFTDASSPSEINCLSTRGLFVHLEDMKLIGKFRSKLLPHYITDYEYTMRALRKGLNLSTDPSLFLIHSPKTTGELKLEAGSLAKCFICLFSRRYIKNPIYWTNFVVLTCPWKWIPLNIIRVWVIALKSIIKCWQQKSVL